MSEKAIDYDDPGFNRGVTHAVELLAKTLGVADWVAGDGSEDYDEDLAQTLMNIIEAKGLYSSEDGSWAALPPLRAREEIARQIYTAWMKDERHLTMPVPYFWAELAADAIPAVQGEGRGPEGDQDHESKTPVVPPIGQER